MLDQKQENEPRKNITKWDLFKVFLASFFMQSVWNFRSLISIGFSICFVPIVGKLCKTPEAKRDFFERHLKFFNAHPYFASFALGVSIRLEELRGTGETDVTDRIDHLKDLLIGPLGALGDRLFWATIKPASLILGMVGILISPSVTLKIIALVVTFLVYNIPHFYYRYEGILEGYNHPVDIHKYISQQRFELLRNWYMTILMISTLLLLGIFSYHIYMIEPALVAIFALTALYALFLGKYNQNFYLVNLATLVFFLVVGILFF